MRYACAFIILSVPAIYFFTQDIDRDITIAVVDSEIVPGASKAILYMANGSIVDLGIHQQDTLREEDGTIIGLHGESITYTNTTDSTIRENLYNELVIPRGSCIRKCKCIFRESGNKRGDCRSISTGCKGGAIG